MPEYQQMLADIRSGAIESVVAYDADRLQRQPLELEEFIILCEKHNVKMATVGGDFELSTEQGQYYARLEAARSRREVQRKSARQKDANRQRAKAGKTWVQRTFGYDGDEIVEHEADAIRKASHALLNGASLWSIALQWNSEGLRTAKGNTWTGGTVRQVLSRARNAGLQSYDGEVLDNVTPAWKPIVERDVWEAVCKLLADPKRHTGKSQGRKHLLSGIAICDVCGKTMGTTARKVKGGNRVVYQCKRLGCMKIVRDLEQTDKRIVDAITKRLAEPDAAVTLASPTVDTAALRDKINDLRAQIAQAEHDYDEGLITAARLNARIERVNEKLTPLRYRTNCWACTCRAT